MVTVAIPAFKSTFLAEAISSVLSQTYSDFELIIVNDASPQGIKTIVDTFGDKRIRYIENKVNLGKQSVARNWNECLRHSRGDLFVLFSDDDLYEPTFLEEMVSMSSKYPEVNIFHCRVRIMDAQGKTIDYAPLCPEYENTISFLWHRMKSVRLHFASDFLCRTAALKNIGGFVDLPQAWGADDLTWCLLAQTTGIRYSPKTLFNYRESEVSITRSGKIAGKLQALCAFETLAGEMLESLPCGSQEDGDLLQGIRAELPHWLTRRKADQVVGAARRHGKSALFWVVVLWLKYRRKYELSAETLMRSLAGGLKVLCQSMSKQGH